MISTINAELGQNLAILQKQSGLDWQSLGALMNDGVVNGVDLNALTYQENVLDTPLIITRAALYIYLNAMVCFSRFNGLELLINVSLVDGQYVMTPRFLIT